jgi:5-methyltetrahydrofolate--homocysteine methyltransferase
MSQKLVGAIANMQEEEALSLARERVADGSEPRVILAAAREAMDSVGRRDAEGISFLPELILAGEMLNQIMDLVKPELARLPKIERRGRVLIGTVEGDIHDIGKNIVTFMLDVNGFEVLDLGVDVPAQKFAQAIRDFQPQVVGLSGFLTLAFDAMKETIEAIKETDSRNKVKIMIGGGQINEEVRKYTGADACGKDALEAIKLAKNWIEG